MPTMIRKLTRNVLVPFATVGLAQAIRATFDPLLHERPFLLFLGSITASAYVGGLRAGLLATGLSLGCVMFTESKFIPFQGAIAEQFQCALFTVEAIVISLLCSALRTARLRAEKHADEASLLQKQVSDAADREQKRIGQDLHDDLGQYLTGVALAGELLARRMDKAGSEHTEETRHFVHMINSAVNRTRQLARGLSPMAVEPDSLPLLLSELQERMVELTERDISFEMNGLPPVIPRESVLHLYRIAQEAVGNALRHAGATRITIGLNCSNSGIVLTVSDNGHGRVVKGTGMGLRVMEFRSKTIGGELSITSNAEGSGTTVRIDLPVANFDE